MESTDKIVVLCTCGSVEEAGRVAEGLVGERLAACVNVVGPVRSIYRWQGQVERAEEVLLVIKTQASRYAELEAAIRRLHSYEVPEVIALRIERGLEGYLRWVGEETA